MFRCLRLSSTAAAEPHASACHNWHVYKAPYLLDCFKLVSQYVSCPYPCLCFPWFSITGRTSHQSPCRVGQQYYYGFKYTGMHMPRRSAIDLGDPLEQPCHDIGLFMGFRPSQYSCPQWIFMENLPSSSGTHVLGYIWSRNVNRLGISTVVRRSSLPKALQRWTIKVSCVEFIYEC